jgi:hypothetical protein
MNTSELPSRSWVGLCALNSPHEGNVPTPMVSRGQHRFLSPAGYTHEGCRDIATATDDVKKHGIGKHVVEHLDVGGGGVFVTPSRPAACTDPDSNECIHNTWPGVFRQGRKDEIFGKLSHLTKPNEVIALDLMQDAADVLGLAQVSEITSPAVERQYEIGLARDGDTRVAIDHQAEHC